MAGGTRKCFGGTDQSVTAVVESDKTGRHRRGLSPGRRGDLMSMLLNILNLFGAVAFFIYGVKLLGEGLESVARGKLHDFMGRLTQHRITAFLVGFILTVILQFSSATVILAMGMVNSGIISLLQAAGIILGANVGTVVKSHFYFLNYGFLMPVCMLLGTYLYLFAGEKRKRDLALTFLGLGIILLGLDLLARSVSVPAFAGYLEAFSATLGSNWLAGILLGTVLTVMIQSSSATMAILVMLAANGSLNLAAAFPVILGANLGTTTTALISSLGTNRDGKRAALLHFLFNFFAILLVLPFGHWLIQLAQRFAAGNLELQIANLHLMFNLILALTMTPLANPVIRLTDLLPGRRRHVEITQSPLLDTRIIYSPTIAADQMVQQTLRMAEYARSNVRLAVEAFLDQSALHFDEIVDHEKYINYLEIQITSFLVKLSASEPTESGQDQLSATHYVVGDLEQIGDLALAIKELAREAIENEEVFSADAKEEIRALYDYITEAIHVAIESFRYSDKNLASTIYDLERHISELEMTARDNHIQRLNRGKCTATTGVLFLELIADLKRISTHCVSIARVTLKHPRS